MSNYNDYPTLEERMGKLMLFRHETYEMTEEESSFALWVENAPGFLQNKSHEETGTSADELFLNALKFMDSPYLAPAYVHAKLKELGEEIKLAMKPTVTDMYYKQEVEIIDAAVARLCGETEPPKHNEHE